MSCTEIYSFDRSGNAHLAAEVRNSLRGGIAIWRIMELRYLPPLPPKYGMECHRYSLPCFGNEESPLQEVWSLADRLDIPLAQRIVLFTTFDNCLVKQQNLPRVISAFRTFEGPDYTGETNLREQADILQSLVDAPDVIAIGWNQTSVLSDNWCNFGGYDMKKEMPIPYNCLTGEKHYWLFDELIEGSGSLSEHA